MLGTLFLPPPISLFYLCPAPPPPSDATSPESLTYMAVLEVELQALPAFCALRTHADVTEWDEVRSYEGIAPAMRGNNLTSVVTLLDETLGWNAIINFPDKVDVTAQLLLKYKAPMRADQFIVIKTEIVSLNGQKATVKGRVEDLEGMLLVEAE
ncbi:hypothetical protein C8R44DRAFT_865879 [Mycena epipterygia]|nr:hypothetical protein C8R44DRAFT_865879 [Mycena epipterygia]